MKCYNYNYGLVHWRVLSKCWCCLWSFHIISAPLSVKVSDLSCVTVGLAQSPGCILFYRWESWKSWGPVEFLVPPATENKEWVLHPRNVLFSLHHCWLSSTGVQVLARWDVQQPSLHISSLCGENPEAIYSPISLPLNHIHRCFFP